MSNSLSPRHDGGRGAEHPPHGPAWKRMHHSPFFWVAFVCIALAMTVYLMTDYFSVMPGKKPAEPVPAVAP